MGSMYWSDEESRYLKAIFSWQDQMADHEGTGGRPPPPTTDKAAAGEFRVLLLGAKGVGKTALVTRFCNGAFQGDSAAADARYALGGRRSLGINGRIYGIDVLELSSQHLPGMAAQSEPGPATAQGTASKITDDAASKANTNAAAGSPDMTVTTAPAVANPGAMMLEQALSMTDAAIVVYDVCDAASFHMARRLFEQLQTRQSLLHQQGQNPRKGGSLKRRKRRPLPPRPLWLSSRQRGERQQQQGKETPLQDKSQPHQQQNKQRPFALMLVGNKSDADDADRRVAWLDGSKAATAIASATAKMTMVTAATATAAASLSSSLPPAVFAETSAKTGDNVTDIFVCIGREILRQRQLILELRESAATAASAASALAPSTALARMESQASSSPSSVARRTMGMFRTLAVPFMRRAVSVDRPRRSS